MAQLYIKRITLPSIDVERYFFFKEYHSQGYKATPYPYGLFPNKGLGQVNFSPITIFCGDNGSGKSTLLNILAKCLTIHHSSPYNESAYLQHYVDRCNWDYTYNMQPWEAKIIASDDVFRQSFIKRESNMSIHDDQTSVGHEGMAMRENHDFSFNPNNPDEVAQIKRKTTAIRKGGIGKLIMQEVGKDIILHSNGENALEYFHEQIRPHGLYLLDEPENSLSIKRQLLLKQYLEEMVQFENCQFVIATHSPFLLALNDAKIYNLDLNPVRVQKWEHIENIRDYYEFFQQNEQLFLQDSQETEDVEESIETYEYTCSLLLQKNGISRREVNQMLDELHNPMFIKEFLEWLQEYQKKYSELMFPTMQQMRGCINNILWCGEKIDIPKE